MTRLLFAAALLAALTAHAQNYPTRPVKLIVPFPAGSATDQVARVVGAELQQALGQAFVVENKAGAQGAIAAAEVAKAAPDGYTLMLTTNTPHAANPSLFKKLNYDPVKDFTPITRYGTTSFMLMVRPDFPAKDLKSFLAHVRSQPGKLSAGYGSSGSQVSVAMLKQLGKLDVVEVPYKGIPQAVTDTMGGSLQFTFVDLANALAQAKGGKLRGLAVTSGKRSALAPDVPAIAEELPGYEIIAWFALMAPAKTPPEIVRVLHDAIAKALASRDVSDKLRAGGTDAVSSTPQELDDLVHEEYPRNRELIKRMKLKID